MLCLKCDNEKFKEKQVKLEQEFKGESFFVVVSAMVCTKCGFEQLTDEQANGLRKATADEYRKRHSLLEADEIKGFRETMKMSQAQFADYLGVGVASIKRWETYFVQEKSQDDLIRIKCDPFFAEKNALEVSWANDMPDVYNGNKKFDINALKLLIVKFLDVAPSPLYFFKHIFYVDFMHFKKFGRSITGMKYSSLQYGPIPKKYDAILEYVLDKKWFEKKGEHDFKALIDFDESAFSTDELAVINGIYDIAKKKGKRHLFEKSHKEKAYKKCDHLGTLSYEFARYVNV